MPALYEEQINLVPPSDIGEGLRGYLEQLQEQVNELTRQRNEYFREARTPDELVYVREMGFVSKPFLNLKAATTLTIASGVVTATQSFHKVAVESGSTDDLETINGGTEGDILIVYAADDTKDIVVKDTAVGGNIRLSGAADYTLSETEKTLALIYNVGGFWAEIGRGDN